MIEDSWGSSDVEVTMVLRIECKNTVNSYFLLEKWEGVGPTSEAEESYSRRNASPAGTRKIATDRSMNKTSAGRYFPALTILGG